MPECKLLREHQDKKNQVNSKWTNHLSQQSFENMLKKKLSNFFEFKSISTCTKKQSQKVSVHQMCEKKTRAIILGFPLVHQDHGPLYLGFHLNTPGLLAILFGFSFMQTCLQLFKVLLKIKLHKCVSELSTF